MTKTNICFNSDYTVATVSKSFMKKAHIYGTKEFNELRKVLADFPEITIKEREIKKNPDKDSYKNLTYANMETYIKVLENKDALMAEFNRQKKLAVIAKNPYRYVLNWFRSACFTNELEFIEFRKTIALVDCADDGQMAIA